MYVQPLVNSIRASLEAHAVLAGDDPSVEAAVEHLLDAVVPALRQVVVELAEQAAAEVGAQLPDRAVDVILVDGDPMLRVRDADLEPGPTVDEEFDARITLRLPPRLKQLIEDAATASGDSVNAFVVDALSSRARRRDSRSGGRVHHTFDL